jgi:hypothetical protein
VPLNSSVGHSRIEISSKEAFMTVPFSGGCACGSVRYECSSEPLAMLNCHCHDCQQSSGAPFASGVVVPRNSVEITGSPKEYSVRASSGVFATRSFCSNCGSPLFTTGEAMPDFISIRFTSFDDSSEFHPALDIWTSSAASWVCLNEELPHFAQSPPLGPKE